METDSEIFLKNVEKIYQEIIKNPDAWNEKTNEEKIKIISDLLKK